MLSARHNDILTQVGRETPMGRFMREYWVPACLSKELVSDREPLRLLILGEKLIGFRDTSGNVGIFDQRCPHRCASLYFGRNEQDGIRCVYHGWKFDVRGNCVDMPNVPADRDFKQKVKAIAYPAVERNGVVWVYMGNRSVPPPMPEIEALLLNESQVNLRCIQRECNWLQALEGDIDTSHFGFLHVGSLQTGDVDPENLHYHGIADRQPRYHVRKTDWGTMYCGYRSAGENRLYCRISHYVFPFFTLFPEGNFEDHIVAQAWVPMDDTHTMVFNFMFKNRTDGLMKRKDGSPIPGFEQPFEWLPNTPDWYGRWRGAANRSNDYLIDREAQRTRSFTGIQCVPVQDQAIIESMGEIVDRRFEHLSPSDVMVVQTRRALLKAVEDHEANPASVPWLSNPSLLRHARSGAYIAPADQDWLDGYVDRCRSALSPNRDLVPGFSEAADEADQDRPVRTEA